MAGVLRIVATPIGNLKDISERAKEILAESSLILAEDTRHSGHLLAALGITKPRLVSCNQHNELERAPVVRERLALGENVALISDAGAPAISDPGGRLVDAIAKEGYRVEAIPGPSAVIAALMGAGLHTHRYVFLGFLPKKGKERTRLIEDAMRAGFALVIYEAPKRVNDTLVDLHALCGPRRVVVARELTKQFETFHRGLLGGELTPPFVALGEAVIVVEAGDAAKALAEIDPLERIQTYFAQGLSKKEIAKRIARELRMSGADAYKLVLSLTANK